MRLSDLKRNAVYVTKAKKGRSAHIDESCHQIRGSYTEKRVDVLDPDMHVCRTCTGSHSARMRRSAVKGAKPSEKLAAMEPEDLGL